VRRGSGWAARSGRFGRAVAYDSTAFRVVDRVASTPVCWTQSASLSKAALRDRCASLRPGPVTSPLAATKHAIRALARRWILLDPGQGVEQIIDAFTQAAAPAMRLAFGIGPDIAAELLTIAGDRPTERLRSEAAFAKLCGAAPIPASSGMTHRYRLNPGGHPTGQQRALNRPGFDGGSGVL
jgi:hypothetical protein